MTHGIHAVTFGHAGKVIPFDCLNDDDVEGRDEPKTYKGFIYHDGVKHCIGDAVFIIPRENPRCASNPYW